MEYNKTLRNKMAHDTETYMKTSVFIFVSIEQHTYSDISLSELINSHYSGTTIVPSYFNIIFKC